MVIAGPKALGIQNSFGTHHSPVDVVEYPLSSLNVISSNE